VLAGNVPRIIKAGELRRHERQAFTLQELYFLYPWADGPMRNYPNSYTRN
jgi:hypothetical protein